ncbi:hypothetical protein RO3G_07171 [Rhizopus delemar RA 99-880]|uniref:Uncharacterized protein n=1 Tax=Rhizopus delemar (strain RA 99-880 / ATCC MYA-4621 / FGSC 9543 / NRRL 43880) TaxID=246409 RepID=I1C1Y6_RHIO9|nr:hypothetical protein RO3G_07171 [Rhizopus delemar RA 99-880]|eukprot:EIE82466.1 hypothetical protein RO3G_07171 [Rhizopus delemar RA 99-880]
MELTKLNVFVFKWDGSGAMVWRCFWKGGFGLLEMIDTGSVDQETYIHILANRFHPWISNVTVHQEKGLYLPRGWCFL